FWLQEELTVKLCLPCTARGAASRFTCRGTSQIAVSAFISLALQCHKFPRELGLCLRGLEGWGRGEVGGV
ncbi:hypothetical protein DVA76_18120, partial [Acinetobacter baumannii]